jgi:hypothetical protein
MKILDLRTVLPRLLIVWLFVYSAPASARSGLSAGADSLELTHASMRMLLIHDQNRSIDWTGTGQGTHSGTWANGGKRSPPLAFSLSAVLPGAGQAYNRQWIKAAVAVTIEAVLIATYYSTHNDGLDAEDAFKAFAHNDWDPSRYGNWLNDYTDYLNTEYGAGIEVPIIETDIGVDFQNPQTWTAANRAAVNAMFSEMNRTERSLYHVETGASFSHQLPGFGDQQYYELIGKYFQFAPGWSDYPVWVDEEGNYTSAIDPELSGPNGTKPNVSDKFYAYAKDHAASQDLLRDASRYGLFILLNHVVAAVDAVVSAKLHNDRLTSRLGLAMTSTGAAVPVAGLGFRF